MITCTRHHDFSAGHRVSMHESKCRHLHGHNYRIHFTCSTDDLDCIGRVIDFGFIKSEMCQWLEDNWDHRLILWEKDPLNLHLGDSEHKKQLGVVFVPFNPTAENMAQFLLYKDWALPHGVTLTKVVVEETRKCSAEASK